MITVSFGINTDADIFITDQDVFPYFYLKNSIYQVGDLEALENGFIVGIFRKDLGLFYLTNQNFSCMTDKYIVRDTIFICFDGIWITRSGESFKIVEKSNFMTLETKGEFRSASVMLFCNDQYVLFRNSENKKFSDPGGKVMAFETVEQGAARELFEETGGLIRIKPSDLLKCPTVGNDHHTSYILHVDDFDIKAYFHNIETLKALPKAPKRFLETDNVIIAESLNGVNMSGKIRKQMLQVSDLRSKVTLKKCEKELFPNIITYTL